jgi:catechol-2,3-dioxygenase
MTSSFQHPDFNSQERFMATQERHKGRLIDHIGLVVRDLAASKAFYSAVFGALKIPIGGSEEESLMSNGT